MDIRQIVEETLIQPAREQAAQLRQERVMLKEVVNLMGPVIDVGDLPEGRGFAIAREGKSICVTGLSEEQTREFGKLMGNFVAIQIHAVLNEPAP